MRGVVVVRVLVAVVAGALALGAAACGGDDDGDGGQGAAETPPAEAEREAGGVNDTPAPTPSKPEVEVPSGDPPSELETKDLKEGKGEAARKGDTVSVHYVGVGYGSGEQFDASWDRGEPFSFTLGAGEVIEGWDRGVAGMRPGGRRRLVIPPDLGYGERGSPPAIGPNETLVFVVDLIEAR